MTDPQETARHLDRADPLQDFREQFFIPKREDGSDQLYFCGHSLGLQPKSAAATLDEELEAWRDLAVRGHFEGPGPWMSLGERLCEPLGELLGASPAELVVMNTLTVNLHLLMVSFFRPAGRRRKILIERHAFPSDRYAVESQLRFHGLDPAECLVELGPPPDAEAFDEGILESFLAEHGAEIALVLWPGVQYASGQAFDLERISEAARDAGAGIGFDLAHMAGNLPLRLSDCGADFAAWCHYKYLNAGPGAVAGAFVHARHHGRPDLPRLHGWWGNAEASRFRMAHDFEPEAGAGAWQLSNPPILAMAPLRASLDLFQRAGLDRLREKSKRLTAYLAEGITTGLDQVLEVITPSEPERRGCQLSLRVRGGRDLGRSLFHHLEAAGAVVDWREPDIIRVAPVPLYNRFGDCWRFLELVSGWAEPTGSPSAR
jgi:kynureninase